MVRIRLKYEINPIYEVPEGYQLDDETIYERQLWEQFWQYALDQNAQEQMGIKNAQLEAPGTKFLPGFIYTLKIEHDGGLRIDAQPLSEILKGETIMP